MKPLTREHELQLAARGFQYVAGADEAGRGALAGPLVAAAVIIPHTVQIPGVQDSKLLEETVREQLYTEITARAYAWNVAVISETVIDTKGLQYANLTALTQAVEQLPHPPEYVFIDAYAVKLPYPTEAVIHGDREIFPIACASIIAKVTRDRIMRDLERHFPAYTFATHKGYGTRQHRKEIHRYGFSTIHRKSFHLKKWK